MRNQQPHKFLLSIRNQATIYSINGKVCALAIVKMNIISNIKKNNNF